MIIQIEPWIDSSELDELKRVVQSTFVTENELTDEFEATLKDYTKSKHAISMCNGTMAIFAALKALNIGYGDEVIVPDMTFIATANAVILAGAKPVFCDIHPKTFCIDLESAGKKISDKTRAIIPVHLYGQSADMEAVIQFANKNHLKVIEDAAQGVGVKFNGKHVGTFGDIGILSFYGNKTITCGEGGMILTEDDALAKKCFILKNHGRERKGTFKHDYIGYNFSFTEMQAAVGISQMKKLPSIIEKKRKIHDTYVAELSSVSDLIPVYIDPKSNPVFWFTSFLSDDVERLAQFLLEQGIQTRRFFYPLHLQPCYLNSELVGYIDNDAFRNSTNAYNRGISLPSSYLLKSDEQIMVIEQIRKFYENRN